MKERVIEVLCDFNDELVEDLEQDLFLAGKLDSFDLVKLVVELDCGRRCCWCRCRLSCLVDLGCSQKTKE